MTIRGSGSLFERFSSQIHKVHPAASLPAIALGAWIMAPVLVIGATAYQGAVSLGAPSTNAERSSSRYIQSGSSASSGSAGAAVMQLLFGVAPAGGNDAGAAAAAGDGGSGGGTNAAKPRRAVMRQYATRQMPDEPRHVPAPAAPLPVPIEIRSLRTANAEPARGSEAPPQTPFPARNEPAAPVERPPVAAPRAVFPFPVVIMRSLPFMGGRPMPMGRYYARGFGGGGRRR